MFVSDHPFIIKRYYLFYLSDLIKTNVLTVYTRDHSFSTYAKFSEILTFGSPDTRMYVIDVVLDE